ncbi:MobA/MobL family protein [Dyella sp. GSA-30]|uniref:MobA/MobL family protein n=1 Tax=Dyella sp. GSA-30 TaxID=2994496 RepID=UPI002493C0F1|nr:MobA/MobL family protein [Dyella sp. GSA-30]BDU18613.1 hypothetical protein DYGSA30_00700 [Dyella sp. GSA-30]
MQVHQHARPHMETHTRSAGHSAVAGVAYRLGLKLYDERQKVWHDFRKRALGEEVVRALTLAPPDAPFWSTDPAQLWNRVEASEKRKDSQLARDYRIPIPFGLDDSDAGDLAEEMARFIVETLHTPVSLGLHRDADRDALGVLKPKDKQGFHAHIYFPTRPLADVAGEDEGKDGSQGFGAKLTFLSNKNTSAAFVEMLNCKWSELATDYARRVGSDLTYQYRSYKRLGLKLTPQPTLGRSATAMERRGLYTNRGDSLREAKKSASDGAKPFATIAFSKRRKAYLGTPSFVPRQGSLAYRLRASAPSPKNKEESDELDRSLVLIEALDKAFAVYHEIQQELDKLFKIIEAARAASLDAAFQADQSREHRKLAYVRLRRWEDENRWRVKIFASMGGAPLAKHEALRSNVKLHSDHVQSLKQTIATHAREVVDAENEVHALKVKQDEAFSAIRTSMANLDEAKSSLLPNLMRELSLSDTALLKEQLPVLFQGGDGIEKVSEGIAEQDQVGLGHRPFQRPS